MMRHLLLVLALSACVACRQPSAPAAEPAQGPIASDGANGYQHGADRSKFLVGDHMRRLSENGYVKRVGDAGVFAINEQTGAAYGVPHATNAAARRPPLGTSAEEHNRFVHDYFVNLGLPVAQVKGVRGNTLVEASGRLDEATPAPRRVSGYYSVLERVVDVIDVRDSFAWARVNADGQVVEEAVYWPALSAQVVAEARRLRAALDDATARAGILGRIPVDTKTAQVAIRHSAATAPGAFQAFACIDVLTIATSAGTAREAGGATGGAATRAGVVRHFAENGEEKFLPQETLRLDQRFPEPPKR